MRGKPNPFPSSEYALLGFLYANPTHGYDLFKLITDPSGVGAIWGVKMSNLYAQLEKLEKKGYITGELLSGESHPTKTRYQISIEGKTAFHNWLVTTVKHPRDFRHEFMLRLFFLEKYQPELRKQVISNQLLECKKWLAGVPGDEESTNQMMNFAYSVFEFRKTQIKSMIEWLEWLLDQSKYIIPSEVANEKV